MTNIFDQIIKCQGNLLLCKTMARANQLTGADNQELNKLMLDNYSLLMSYLNSCLDAMHASVTVMVDKYKSDQFLLTHGKFNADDLEAFLKGVLVVRETMRDADAYQLLNSLSNDVGNFDAGAAFIYDKTVDTAIDLLKKLCRASEELREAIDSQSGLNRCKALLNGQKYRFN